MLNSLNISALRFASPRCRRDAGASIINNFRLNFARSLYRQGLQRIGTLLRLIFGRKVVNNNSRMLIIDALRLLFILLSYIYLC